MLLVVNTVSRPLTEKQAMISWDEEEAARARGESGSGAAVRCDSSSCTLPHLSVANDLSSSHRRKIGNKASETCRSTSSAQW